MLNRYTDKTTSGSGMGLYVHFPFCGSRCNYCDFYSGKFPTDTHFKYIEALSEELRERFPHFNVNGAHHIGSIYFGGGTPSLLSSGLLTAFSRRIDEICAGYLAVDEFTIEVNPEDVDADRCRDWRDAGINRVSLGVQSFDDAELRVMGRRHDSRRALQALETLCKYFDNVSIDLITGVPGQTPESVGHSLRMALESGARHVSAYTLSYEPHSVMSLWLKQGKISDDEDLTVEMLYKVHDTLTAGGFLHYEISNFARPGMESRHNSSYWTGRPYLGLGPAAHSYDGRRCRSWNPAHIRAYIRHYSSKERNEAFYDSEILDDTQLLEEYVMLRLRMYSGLDFGDMRRRFGDSAAREVWRRTESLVRRMALETFDNKTKVRLTRHGLALADSVTRDLLL